MSYVCKLTSSFSTCRIGRATRHLLLITCFSLLSGQVLTAQKPATQKNTPQPPKEGLTRILFIFDASFSMFAPWESGMRMDVAKNMMIEFLDSLKKVNHLELALRVYGHQVPLRPQPSCEDTKLEVPFGGKENITAIKNKIKSLVPRGTTPIAYSLEQSGKDFPHCSTCKNVIILITDGLEECGGDPCAISLALQKNNAILKPFIIGIGMEPAVISAFGCMGKYYDASSESTFKSILNTIVSEVLNNTTAQVNLLDLNGKPSETDVNMTFYEEYSGKIRYNYIHTLNHRGNPDTLILDPSPIYKIVVHTIPPVAKSGIRLKQNRHTTIAIDAPQGYLNLKITGANDKKTFPCVIRKAGKAKTLHVQTFNKTEKYIVGQYDLEVLTLPRIKLNNVKVEQNTTTTIEIPQSGNVTIQKSSEGPGSIYVEENDKLTWVCNLKNHLFQETFSLQPGKYRLEFRSKNLKRSIYSIEKKFTIASGVSSVIKL